MDFMNGKKCSVCGKEFFPSVINEWGYKHNGKLQCSNKCNMIAAGIDRNGVKIEKKKSCSKCRHNVKNGGDCVALENDSYCVSFSKGRVKKRRSYGY